VGLGCVPSLALRAADCAAIALKYMQRSSYQITCTTACGLDICVLFVHPSPSSTKGQMRRFLFSLFSFPDWHRRRQTVANKSAVSQSSVNLVEQNRPSKEQNRPTKEHNRPAYSGAK